MLPFYLFPEALHDRSRRQSNLSLQEAWAHEPGLKYIQPSLID